MNDLGRSDLRDEFAALQFKTHARRQGTNPIERLLIVVYQLVSDFGRSVVRPGLFEACILLISVSGLSLLGLLSGASYDPRGLLFFAIQHIFVPFTSLGHDYTPPPTVADLYSDHTWVFQLTGGLISLSTIVVIALAVLAARRRFVE